MLIPLMLGFEYDLHVAGYRPPVKVIHYHPDDDGNVQTPYGPKPLKRVAQ